MNILQQDQNVYLKCRIFTEIEVKTKREENRAILTQNKYLKYNTDFWDIE